ncbi:DNA repair protein rad18 [Sodiomyces alkalinus F11]|uniref:Postreplication repair E3 ubiquitin-protein ligase RAD18 n=1 Tax=Sodiomyces alkalinus (strain CBS 110278 / VKM F-3762 / F11) TaxID=1314773 RepID=A0A3N2Q514_SODAK|nr:DNA repair protein rad18 [Sodiomyces alkalinus F11]ROT41852.1 DNA repair protein rad18 [Sodiomyces alkalinus F11]
MATEFIDVPDSTDWLSTPLSGLAVVEASLRCQVCKDFYRTPMLTSCCHTFCSLCIRHALANDGRCPLCRSADQESKLRNNWSMDEVVESFAKTRKAILDFARARPSPDGKSSPKRKMADREGDVVVVVEEPATKRRRLRSSARLSSAKARDTLEAVPSSVEEILIRDSDDEVEGEEDEDEDEQDDAYEPEPDDGLVPCPICQARMKQWQVFKHLDTCTGPPDRTSSTSRSRPNGQMSSHNNTHISAALLSTRQPPPPTKRPERLPALNYSILKDQALRKKMAELGLSTTGSRQLLERRHKEWITLWNANCDSSRPKRRAELLHDLDVWERTQGGKAAAAAATFGGNGGARAVAVRDKDFDAAAWASKHDTSFRDLVANARRSRDAVDVKQDREEEKNKGREKEEEEEKEKEEEKAGQKVVAMVAGDASEPSPSGERKEASLSGPKTEGVWPPSTPPPPSTPSPKPNVPLQGGAQKTLPPLTGETSSREMQNQTGA